MTKVYSVPRRYDLATMFVVSIAFALLFSLLRLLHFEIWGLWMVTSFLTVVGAAQAILFRGKSPRLASLIGGIGYWFVYYLYRMTLDPAPRYWSIGQPVAIVVSGSISGYVGGNVVAGVFLVADLIRKAFRRQ